MIVEQLPQGREITERKRQSRFGQRLRDTNRFDPRIQVCIEVGFGVEVRGQIPIVPAVISAEQHLVAPSRTASDPDRDRTRLTAALGVAHHLGTRNRPA
ncbi:MAG TPA: hypothetical protein VK137_06815, partial [Planctomycetaceae bacterium]|nr:hypothetical protein [Planctomycetaceae bacterium]